MEVLTRLDEIRKIAFSMMKNDISHDTFHIIRVYKNAELLCEKENVDPELVLASVLLHDLISFKKSDPRNKTASDQSAEKTVEILKKLAYDDDDISIISDAIRDHSFSKNTTPSTIVGKILQDADRLDAIGAIGIARVFAVGGAEKRPLYNADDPFCDFRGPDDARWSVDHFYQKLLRLEGLMNTATGKSIARERTIILENFLEQLRRELD